MEKTGVWGRDYLSDFYKAEYEEIILSTNLETKEVSPRSGHYLEEKFLTKH